MKKILFILFLTAALIIAGCASDGGGEAGTNTDIDGSTEEADAAEESKETKELKETNENGEEEAEAEEPADNEPPPPPLSAYIITSPYADVDWASFGQYKAALHVHSSNSDGDDNLAAMIEEYYRNDYDILAITDHDYLTSDWVSARNGLTRERFNEIAAGSDRNGRGMLQIPHTNEQSAGEHLNTYFADYNNSSTGMTLEKNIKAAQSLGGICRINNPGVYTGGKIRGEKGENASKDLEIINKYADLFMKYPACVGMEILIKKDSDTLHDRILWDNILKQTVPQGRYVWGFADDDAHRIDGIGYACNVFVMPENTLENFKDAMYSGSFYAVARASSSRREVGNSGVGTGPIPYIIAIEIDNEYNAAIAIAAANYTKIQWISDGRVIAVGETLNIMAVRNRVGSYVRANIIGPGGIAYTQPFGISLR